MIKQCTVADIPALQQISEETFYDTFASQNSEKNMRDYLATAYVPEKLTRELNTPNNAFYFLYEEDEIVGYLKVNMLQAQSEPMGDDHFEIERIYVRQAYQKRGFGKVLMNHALSLAKAAGKQYVWLGVWEKNENAIGFYKKIGFRQVGAHDFMMGDEAQTDFILEKKL